MQPRLQGPPGFGRQDRRQGGGPGPWLDRGGRQHHHHGGRGGLGGYHNQGREDRRSIEREHEESPSSPIMETPRSPEVADTPLSPDKVDRFQPRSIPLEPGVKSIPLEKDESRPKLSEEERKLKLLKLQMKLAGKSSKEISENLSSSQSQPTPDSQLSSTEPPAPRPSWLSPQAPTLHRP